MDRAIAFDHDDEDDDSEDQAETLIVQPQNPKKRKMFTQPKKEPKNLRKDDIPESSSHSTIEQAFLRRLNQLRTPQVEALLSRVKVRDVPIVIPNRYRDLPLILPNRSRDSSRTDWTDADMMNRPGVALRLLDDDGVVKLGRAVLKVLTSYCSERAVAGILVLAWNLRSPQTFLPVFPEDDPTATGDDFPISRFSSPGEYDFTYSSGEVSELTDSLTVDAAGYAYFAASLLRLATKPTESYLAALPGIKQSFRTFYDRPFPLQNLVGNKKMIEYVRMQMQTQMSRLRNSLTGFLYVHEQIHNGKDLRKYLYEQHLQCTGLHACDLATRILMEKRFTLSTLCSYIRDPTSKEALEELCMILQKNGTASALQTWRYARVFDPQYFGKLQTKNCKQLVYILATLWYATNAQDDQSAGDVFKITHFETIIDIDKFFFTTVAFKAYSDPGNTGEQNWKVV